MTSIQSGNVSWESMTVFRYTHVFDTNVIQSLSNLHLGLSGEVSSGKLLTLTESSVDDVEVGKAARASHGSCYRAAATAETGETVCKRACIIRFVIVVIIVVIVSGC